MTLAVFFVYRLYCFAISFNEKIASVFKSATDGNGNTVTYRYNCINKLSQRTDAAGESEFFSYDMEGRLSEYTDRNGRRYAL